MKFKKIISAVSAFAMAISLVTVANAASLGGKPSVKATFDGYEKVSDTVAFAYVNITLDMSAAEALEAYSNELDEITWEEIVKGNGISTFGIPYAEVAGFTYTKAKSTIPSGLTVNSVSIVFDPKTNPEDYWVTPVTTVRLALRAANFDSKGTFTIDANQVTVAGKDSASGEVWGYKSLDNQITVESCEIPSYNEWSTPAEEDKTEAAIGSTGDVTFDYAEGDSASSALSGQRVVLDTAGNKITGDVKDKKVAVTYTEAGAEPIVKTFGETLNELLGLDGDGSVTATVRFGIVCDPLLKGTFTFAIVD